MSKRRNKPAAAPQQINPNRWCFYFPFVLTDAAGGVTFGAVPVEVQTPNVGLGQIKQVIEQIEQAHAGGGGIVGQRPKVTILDWKFVGARYEAPAAPPVAPDPAIEAMADVTIAAISRASEAGTRPEGESGVDHDSDDEA